MSEIKPDQKLYEVMRRTMWNLRFIIDHAKSGGPYGVVQLVNSFAGAMAHPWEDMRRLDVLEFERHSLKQARDRGWPLLEKEPGHNYRDPANYKQMLQWIRNGFAHGNVEFENADGQIAKIRVCNRPDGVNSNWCAVADVSDLEDFLWYFQNLARGGVIQHRSAYPRIFAHAAD